MSEELWRIFHADDVEESELAQVIARQLPAARQVAPDEVEYLHSHAEGDYSLKLVYEGSELIALEAGAALLQADIEAIEQGLDAILPTDEITVGVSILFHGVPVNGWWRYRDSFQILPVPESSPKPATILGAHPFLLEVSLRESSDMMTRIHRRERRVRILDLVLGSFLRHMVRGPDSWHREFWVYLPHSDPVEGISSVLLQEGYSLAPGKVQPFSTSFSPTDGLKPLDVLDDEDYFNIRGIGVGEELRVPSSLIDLLDAFHGLPVSARSRFTRHVYWLRQSGTLWNFSQSASFVALINSVEALVPERTPGETCSACGRDLGAGQTKQFVDFVDQWVPAAEGEDRRKLYRVRSAITHGGKLLRTDLDSPGHYMHPEWNEQRGDFDVAQRVARLAGINWLLAQRSS